MCRRQSPPAARAHALRRPSRGAGAFGAVDREVAVLVEHVVDDLEQQAELLAELAPRKLVGGRNVGCPEPAAHGCCEQPAGLQAVEHRQVVHLAVNVEVLATDHAEGRLRKLLSDLGRRIGGRLAKGLGQERIAREDCVRLPETGPLLGRPRRISSLSSAGRSSWTSENEWTSSSAAAAGSTRCAGAPPPRRWRGRSRDAPASRRPRSQAHGLREVAEPGTSWRPPRYSSTSTRSCSGEGHLSCPAHFARSISVCASRASRAISSRSSRAASGSSVCSSLARAASSFASSSSARPSGSAAFTMPPVRAPPWRARR